MKKIRIGLISHLVKDFNLGCSALAISNIKLMDEIFSKEDITVEYVVILAEPKEEIDLKEYTSLDGITKNKFIYRTYPRLKPILKNPFLLSKTKAFEDCDYIVDICGGDGYTDNYGLIRLLAESVPVYGAKKKNTPVIFAPQTIGPFNTAIGKFIAKQTLNNLNALFVRDKASYNCCQELKLNKDIIQVIDVAFALPFDKIDKIESKFKVGINVSGLLYSGGYNRKNYFGLSFSYSEFIIKLLDILTKDNQIEVHLIPHVISDEVEVEDDYRACEKLSRIYPKCILAPKFKTAKEAKSYISGMDLFSGARMHATIGATSSGVPVIPVAYSRKFNGLYDTLEYPYYIDAKAKITCEEAINKFMEYLNDIDKLEKGIKRAEAIYKVELEKYKKKMIDIFKSR